ncbi:branched-chain amino acid ABC transporter permease [Castellaniella ginsengisoli]|uniref:Branched-chain amino acid ABC transporter permease n=1 Tax=Castellaniella ginsengisoli TaxID=546114 RepID=A0AB39CIK3_9BURK
MTDSAQSAANHNPPLDSPEAETVDARDAGGARSSRFVGGVLALVLAGMWIAGWLSGTSTEDMLSLTAWGVMLGGIIALGGIGLTLCYGVLKFPNFAHGEFLTLGAYVTYGVVLVLPQSNPIWRFSFGWELVVGLLLAAALTALVAILIDRLLYRPLRKHQSPLVLLAMASLGMEFLLRGIVYLVWGSDFHFYYSGRSNPALYLPFGLRLQADQLFVFALAIVLVALLYWMLTRTRIGKAMRATADNPDLAQVRGIDTEQVVAWTWAIGAGLAAIGGVMYGLASQMRPDMGFVLLLPLFAAVIMGGIGSAWGALVGSIIIGIAMQLTSAFLNPAYGPAVAFVLMVLVLLMRPQGLFAQR